LVGGRELTFGTAVDERLEAILNILVDHVD